MSVPFYVNYYSVIFITRCLGSKPICSCVAPRPIQTTKDRYRLRYQALIAIFSSKGTLFFNTP